MQNTENLIETLHKLHCDNAVTRHFAHRPGRKPKSTMPVTSFVFEFFLYNSIYQYDWDQSLMEGRPTAWDPAESKEWKRQLKLERYLKGVTQEDPSLISSAFAPIVQLEDLDGSWTEITPDSRCTLQEGEQFFVELAELRDRLALGIDVSDIPYVFKKIKKCRLFIYQIRNNIFHGSKSIGDYWDGEQSRRIDVYDRFLKSLVSLFFLSVGRSPVAADTMHMRQRPKLRSSQ